LQIYQQVQIRLSIHNDVIAFSYFFTPAVITFAAVLYVEGSSYSLNLKSLIFVFVLQSLGCIVVNLALPKSICVWQDDNRNEFGMLPDFLKPLL